MNNLKSKLRIVGTLQKQDKPSASWLHWLDISNISSIFICGVFFFYVFINKFSVERWQEMWAER